MRLLELDHQLVFAEVELDHIGVAAVLESSHEVPDAAAFIGAGIPDHVGSHAGRDARPDIEGAPILTVLGDDHGNDVLIGVVLDLELVLGKGHRRSQQEGEGIQPCTHGNPHWKAATRSPMPRRAQLATGKKHAACRQHNSAASHRFAPGATKAM